MDVATKKGVTGYGETTSSAGTYIILHIHVESCRNLLQETHKS